MNLIFYKFRLFTFNNLYSLFIVLFLISCYDNRNYKAVSKSTKLINSTETIVKKKSSQNHTLKTLITSKKIHMIPSVLLKVIIKLIVSQVLFLQIKMKW